MSNKKQTAFCQYVNDTLKGEVKEVSYYLELEKQQIINAWVDGDARICQTKSIPHAEQYYNETYE